MLKEKVFLIICVVMFLSGCVGVGAGYKGNRMANIANPNISSNKGYIDQRTMTKNLITKNELLQNWGEPDLTKKVDENSEEITYKFRVRWNGIIIMALAPIPLVIPVGHDYIRFTINNGLIENAYIEDDSSVFYAVCGYILHTVEGGCAIHNDVGHTINLPPYNFWEQKETNLIRQ